LINAQQLAQGVHDAISGKASMTDKDRENLRVWWTRWANPTTARAKFLATT